MRRGLPGMNRCAMSRTRPIQKTWLPKSIVRVANHNAEYTGPTSRKGVSKKEHKAISERAIKRFRNLEGVIDCIAVPTGRDYFLSLDTLSLQECLQGFARSDNTVQ